MKNEVEMRGIEHKSTGCGFLLANKRKNLIMTDY